MRKLVLRGLWAHTRRFVSTFVAVFLGVAFLAGTLVLGDTLAPTSTTLFTEANAGTDAVIRNATDVTTETVAAPGSIDASALDTVRGASTASPPPRRASRATA